MVEFPNCKREWAAHVCRCVLAKRVGSRKLADRMQVLGKLLKNGRVRIVLAGLLALVIVGGGVAWKMGVDLVALKSGWTQVNEYLVKYPWTLFLALVFLPGLPIPITALLLAAGVVWRQQPLMACLLCLLALIINLTWTYWLAAGPGRQVVEKMLKATAIEIPELPRGDHLKLILVLKLTPGIPFFFQNYILGFLRAPFRLYLVISVLCNGIYGTGVVLSSVGLADGKLMPVISGISLIVLAAVFTQLVRSWLEKRKRTVAG